MKRIISLLNDCPLFTLLIFISIALQGQTITGKVVDAGTQEPLPFTNVFLNNTTIGTVTDINGEFNLTPIKEQGTYEIVFSYVGYNSYKTKVTVSEGVLKMGSIKLVPSEIQLNTVSVAAPRDKEWERKLKKFKKIFLGEDKLTTTCTILNPWVIDFPKNSTGNKFIARANAPIEISNEGLGYKLDFSLTGFEADGDEYSITGNVRFTEMKSIDAQEIHKWKANREHCYLHSTHHLFKSILEKKINGEGFSLYTDKVGFENTISRSSQFYADLDKTIIAYDTAALVTPDTQKDFYKIKLKDRVEVHYRKERASRPIYNDVFGMVSWVTLNKGYVIVNKNGVPKNPEDVVVSGDMSSYRVAGMLPLDYKPDPATIIDIDDFSIYQEQVYVHPDKPYYYPGETIWFKGYVNYALSAWRDSLSKVMYVELINPRKEIALSKTLKIDSGFFHNNFILPDTLKEGTYYLRAYTNLNRNFGDSTLFVKPIPILNITDKVDHTQGVMEATENNLLTIASDKKIYKTREKITLTLQTKDKEEKPLAANLSISVTDAVQVVPIAEPLTILNGYPFEKKKQTKATVLKYPVEYGVGFSGKFLNDKGKPEKTTLTILQMKPRNMMLAETNEQGIFMQSGMDFYDTAEFLFKSDKAKDYPYGKVKLLPHEIPPLHFKDSRINLILQSTQSKQRIISEYEVPKEVHLLQSIGVRATRIAEEYQKDYRIKRPYGKPDYILKAKDINTSYGNLLLALQGKFPGLIVRQTEKGNWVVYTKRGELSSMSNIKEVMIMLNDVPMGGTPEAILFSINPETVASIEFTNRINVLYGSSSGFGVISIYTKQDVSAEASKVTPNFQSLKISGYSSFRKFRSPNYDDENIDKTLADYRSTIYWNPEIVTDAKTGTATLSFFAADLPGKYRIVAEGVLQNGETVRGVYFLNVESR